MSDLDLRLFVLLVDREERAYTCIVRGGLGMGIAGAVPDRAVPFANVSVTSREDVVDPTHAENRAQATHVPRILERDVVLVGTVHRDDHLGCTPD